MKSAAFLFIAALIFCFPGTRVFGNDFESFNPMVAPQFKGVRFDQHLGTQLPLDAMVTDEYGRARPLGTFIGPSPTILVFSYYECPNLCTLILNGLAQAVYPLRDELGKRFQIVSLSFNPDEKPRLAMAKKRTYLARLGKVEGDPGTAWHFLTATQKQILKITDAAGFYFRKDPKSKEYLHPSGIIIVSPHGKISQYFFGIQFSTPKLKESLTEASGEKTGSLVDRILLYCCHFNPALSRNGPRIMEAIRILGAVSVAALVLLLGFLFKRGTKEGLA